MIDKKVSLKEVVDIKNGFAFKSTEYVHKGARVIRITNVQKGQIVDSNPQFISEARLNEFKEYQLFAGDILVSLTGNVGRVGVLEKELEPAMLNQRVACIRIKNIKEVDSRFLFHCLNTNLFENECIKNSNGIAQLNLSSKWVENYLVSFPLLNEQKKIANILDQADALRQKRKQSLQLLDDFLRATFLDMFGDPVRNNKNWAIKNFGDACPTRLGKMLDAKKQTGKNKKYYLGNSNVLWGKFNLNDLLVMDFDEREMQELRLKKGDVLICEGGEVGRTAIWQEEMPECYFQKAIHRGRPDLSVILPEYILYLMFFYSKNGGFKDYVSVSTIAHLTGVKLKSMPVPVPPINLQKKFALIVNKAKETKQIMQTSQSELDNQFNAMTQRYFG